MKILFQGDSLTDSGRGRGEARPNAGLGNGYVSMICGELISSDPGAGYEVYNRGISGNRISDLFARWIEDALNMEFDLISILMGVNDVGFSLRLGCGSDAARFERIYDMMLSELREKKPDAKIVLVEPFVFRMPYEDPKYGNDVYERWDEWRGEVGLRAEAVKRLAQKHGALFVPAAEIFAELSAAHGPALFTPDCIHLTAAGNAVLAKEWLKAVREAEYI